MINTVGLLVYKMMNDFGGSFSIKIEVIKTSSIRSTVFVVPQMCTAIDA